MLAAGVAAVLVTFVGNTGTKLDTPIRNEAPQVPQKTKNAPLEPSARLVAGRFINSAVARKNLAVSWPLVGPELKAGLTKKDWLSGDIPVIPFNAAIGQVRLKIDSSQPNHALIEALILPKAGGVKPAFFFLEMRKTKRTLARDQLDAAREHRRAVLAEQLGPWAGGRGPVDAIDRS